VIKKALCLMLCAGISLLFQGCESRREPKTLAIILSSFYDLKDDGGYEVTLEMINPSAQGDAMGGGGGKSPNVTVICHGESIPEAIRNVSHSLEKTLFAGHNKARFFTEEFAKKDMVSILDSFLRDHLTDENPLMIVIHSDTPELIYSSKLGLSDTVGDYIESISKAQPDSLADSVFVDTLGFVKDYYDEGKQPVTGVVELVPQMGETPKDMGAQQQEQGQGQDQSQQGQQGQQNQDQGQGQQGQGQGGAPGGNAAQYKIQYIGLAAFKDDKLVGYFNGEEARAYNFIHGDVTSGIISIPTGDGMTALLIHDSKPDIKVSVKNDRAMINVKLDVDIAVIQEGAYIDVSKGKALDLIEKRVNEKLEKEISDAIKKAQTEFESDIFGFGKILHIQDPKQWQKIKLNWDDYFSKAAVTVSVDSAISKSGEIKEPVRIEAVPND